MLIFHAMYKVKTHCLLDFQNKSCIASLDTSGEGKSQR